MQEFTLLVGKRVTQRTLRMNRTLQKRNRKAGYQARIASILTNINLCSTSV